MKVIVYRTTNRCFCWVLKAVNGKIMCSSGGYTRRKNCIDAALRVMKEFKDGPCEIKIAGKYEYVFSE